MYTHRIMIADDHEVVRNGVRLMLKDETEFELVGDASSIQEVFSVAESQQPCLALLDLNMNGKNMLDSIEALQMRFPKLKTVIWSSYDDFALVKLARDKGMDGYILKNTNKTDLLQIMTKILNGGTYFIKKTRKKADVLITYSSLPKKDNFQKRELLSEREIEIIRLVAKGQTEQQMAEVLHISKHTVHTHRKNFMKSLGLHSAVDIVRFAFENGLMEGED